MTPYFDETKQTLDGNLITLCPSYPDKGNNLS